MVRLMAMSAIFVRVPGSYANELVRTPAQTEGPFYPDKLPLDTDNDLGNEMTPSRMPLS